MSDKNTRAMAAPGIRKSKAEAVNAADTRELYKKR